MIGTLGVWLLMLGTLGMWFLFFLALPTVLFLFACVLVWWQDALEGGQ